MSVLHPLLLTETWPPDRGGMSQSCDRIVRGLRRRGVEVDVAVFSRRHERESIEQQEQGRLLCVPMDEEPGHTIQRLWNLLGIGGGLDRVSHVMPFGGFLPLLAAPAFAAWMERPLITLVRGNDFDIGWFSPRRGDVLREAVARSACVCTVSRDHQRKIERLAPSTEVRRVPNGIDASGWHLTEADRAAARAWRARSVAPHRRVLGLFGQLKPKKGAAMFIEALLHSGEADTAHLLMVGDVEPDLRAQLESASGAIAHSLVAPIDRWELLPYYGACDLVVIPSLYDGLPNVALEAGALGVPVLASTAGGLDDLLIDGENAGTFAPGDRGGCRRAIARALAADAGALRDQGQRLRERVVAEFTASAEADGYVEALRRTAQAVRPARHGMPACQDVRPAAGQRAVGERT